MPHASLCGARIGVVVAACGLSPHVGVESVVPFYLLPQRFFMLNNWYRLCTLLKSMLPPPPPPCSTQARGCCLQPIAAHKSAATVTPYSAQEPPQRHPHTACIPHRYDANNDGNRVDDDDITEGDSGGDVEGDSGCHVESNDNGDAEDDGGHGGQRRMWRTMADMEDNGRHGG
ncbi:hypothetical protein EDB86DRAFT_2828829 [Lactarius hatsudake]|nr:hypothetical protein EDB86DRAFT_2828829 [Lactarius hatsudake]